MRIYDNGGRTFDRYTIILSDGHCFGMSKNALWPDGFNQYAGRLGVDIIEGRHLGRQVAYTKLPTDLKKAILQRI